MNFKNVLNLYYFINIEYYLLYAKPIADKNVRS